MTTEAIHIFASAAALGIRFTRDGKDIAWYAPAGVMNDARRSRVRDNERDLLAIVDAFKAARDSVTEHPAGGVYCAKPVPARVVLAILNMEAEQAKGAVAA
jgi:hypothetical protein